MEQLADRHRPQAERSRSSLSLRSTGSTSEPLVDAQLDHLTGAQLAERVVAVVELNGASDQAPAGAVREPPLADAGAARRVQEVVSESAG